MDERLLSLYNTELRHLREMAGEFAREYPKIAGRLAIDRDAKEVCPDPYVERLLEGFAWLAARVHLKLDAEFPRFTQALLETVYPHYLSPVPSMAVVRFEIDPQQPALAAGVPIPRGTSLKSNLGKGERTPCVFQTAHDVTLLPLRVLEARYFTRDIQELNLPPEFNARAALRIRLQTTGGQPLEKINLESLTFYTRGADELAGTIYEQIFSRRLGLVLQSVTDRGKQLASQPASYVRRVGFAPEQALLPPSPRGFEGYRLLREYFALPQRYLFFQLAGLAEGAKRCKGDQIDVIIPLKEQETALERRIDSSCFELFCTPAINLFSKVLDRISLSEGFYEFHVVPDRNRTTDFEIFELESVVGYGANPGEEQEFRPFYLAKDTDSGPGAYYTCNRAPRMLSASERLSGKKSSYAGTELFLSLVDANSAPYNNKLRELGIKALCTNRHLPIQMAIGVGRTDFSMGLSAPVNAVRCVTGPTLPKPSATQGRFFWRLISHLSLNYLTLVDSAKGAEGAAGLRDLLKLYIEDKDHLGARQIDGLLTVHSKPIVRRVAAPGPISFARGLEIVLTFDEVAFEGTGVFILGAVLEQFFAKYVSLNSFTETVVRTKQRGEIMRWPTRMGIRHIL
ncbi:MAG TPA: type VI secretion system baseplate subunit TssF [Verrucomicrobiae bacterium]|nr:type VI secretion system baseplate subunit TssF [Verrucomicrobiae bacterium]